MLVPLGKEFTDDPSVVTILASPDVNGVFEIPANITRIEDDDKSFIHSLVYGNLPTKSFARSLPYSVSSSSISYLLVPLSKHVSQWYCLHIFL